MSTSAESVLREALRLPPNDRAAIVEGLIGSLDRPDPAMDALWLKEAEDRMSAWRHSRRWNPESSFSLSNQELDSGFDPR